MVKLDRLTTESRNKNTLNIDKVSTLEMVKIISHLLSLEEHMKV